MGGASAAATSDTACSVTTAGITCWSAVKTVTSGGAKTYSGGCVLATACATNKTTADTADTADALSTSTWCCGGKASGNGCAAPAAALSGAIAILFAILG